MKELPSSNSQCVYDSLYIIDHLMYIGTCSPPPAGSGLTPPPSVIKSKQPISPVPIGNLLSLTPSKNTPLKPLERRSVSALKNHYHSSSSESDGGSITKLVLLKPFKHLTYVHCGSIPVVITCLFN